MYTRVREYIDHLGRIDWFSPRRRLTKSDLQSRVDRICEAFGAPNFRVLVTPSLIDTGSAGDPAWISHYNSFATLEDAIEEFSGYLEAKQAAYKAVEKAAFDAAKQAAPDIESSYTLGAARAAALDASAAAGILAIRTSLAKAADASAHGTVTTSLTGARVFRQNQCQR